MFRRLASLHRVAVDGRSPCFTGRPRLPFGTIKALRLPAIPPAALGFPSPGGTTGASEFCSPATTDAPSRGRGVACGGHPMPPIIRGNGRTSQVPAETLAAAPMLLRPRKNRMPLALTLHPTRPRLRERPWLLQLDFRGSIAWLDDSLSTLRRDGRPTRRKTRFRLRGCALPGGAFTRWVSRGKVSAMCQNHISFSFRELAWRNPVFGPQQEHGRSIERGGRRRNLGGFAAAGAQSHRQRITQGRNGGRKLRHSTV